MSRLAINNPVEQKPENPTPPPTPSEAPDEIIRRLYEKVASRRKAFRDSERLSEADFAMRINAQV